MSATISDRPGTKPADFSASLVETPGLHHTLTVNGKATADYRISDVHLVRASHQGVANTLVLDLKAKVGPVQNPHDELIRIMPVEFKENAEHRYSQVKIVNGSEHFTVNVIDVL